MQLATFPLLLNSWLKMNDESRKVNGALNGPACPWEQVHVRFYGHCRAFHISNNKYFMYALHAELMYASLALRKPK